MNYIQYETAINAILNSEPHPGANMPNIKLLVEYLAKVTGVSANDNMNNWADKNTEQGVAISPVQAAKCLAEPLRSQKFMQGVKNAINDQIAQKSECINVLYAGTGPYGTLLLPLLSLLKNNTIKVTLIDIHPENITAISKLVTHLNIEDNIVDIVCVDATKWHNPNNISFDIIISETMTALLKREPQVYIFAHLSQYLNISGVLIPQEISLKAWATNNTQKQTLIGEFFRLDINSAKAIKVKDLSSFSGELLIPQNCNIEDECTLTTDITVYKDLHLVKNECSLNVPKTIMPHDANLIAGEKIKYEYVNPSSSYFSFTFPTKNIPDKEIDLVAADELTNNGLILFKRIYQRAQLNRHVNQTTQCENEWHAQTRLYELINLPTIDVLRALYEYVSFELFEQWLNEHCLSLPHKIDVQEINTEVMNYLKKSITMD